MKPHLLFALLVIISGLYSTAATKTAAAQTSSEILISARDTEVLVQVTETDKLLQGAYTLLTQGKLDEALANCTKAAELSPADYRVPVFTGIVYAAQMKLKNASDAFAVGIQMAPRSRLKEIYLLKADVDGRRGAPDEAVAAARKALELDPKYAEAYGLIGEALKGDEKRRAEAIAAYRSAIEIKPNLFPAYESLAQLFEEAGDSKSAEEVFRKAIAADPKHMVGRFKLGRMLVNQHRLGEARELWEGRTSDEDNTFPQFVELLKRAENLKRATDALAQRPKDPDTLVEMGMAVMEGDHWVVDGRQKRAIVYFKNALELKPRHARAQYGIVKAHIQMAATYDDEKKNVDQEMIKLRKLDPALATEMESYRKTYRAGIEVVSP